MATRVPSSTYFMDILSFPSLETEQSATWGPGDVTAWHSEAVGHTCSPPISGSHPQRPRDRHCGSSQSVARELRREGMKQQVAKVTRLPSARCRT